MTIPNFISIARLVLVPAIVWCLIADRWMAAFILFAISGVSDAADGFIARRFNQRSRLGAYLDPIADKALLGAVFVVLGVLGGLPVWIAIAVISRDLLIVSAVILSFMLGWPMEVRPLFISKVTTAFQIVLAGAALAAHAYELDLGAPFVALIWLVALLTVLSAASYLVDWLRHMGAQEAPADKDKQ